MTERKQRFLELYRQGLNDKEIALHLQVARATVRKWRNRQNLKSNVAAKSNRDRSETVCWTCQNALRGCSWSRDFIPVEGWTATPHMLYANDENHGGVQSYEVHDCPEYVPDPPKAKEVHNPLPVMMSVPERHPCVGCNNFGFCNMRGWTCKDKATWEVVHG